ncbi:MAG: methionyl-tRNA formyltransferase [Burkholderiaceae bacterium]
MRIAFAGTPDFAAGHLSALIRAVQDRPECQLTIAGVLTQPDRAAGRGLALTPSPVKSLAQAADIPVWTPQSLRADRPDGPEAQQWLASLDLDWLVVVAYGQLLPKAVLDMPRYGCLNVHASDLPRWRGAAPIQRAIEAGDQQTAICLMQMEEGLDTGPVWQRAMVDILPTDTGQSLHDRLMAVGAEQLTDFFCRPDRRLAQPQPQPEQGVTYAKKILAADRQIDLSRPAQDLVNQIRALEPVPAAQLPFEGQLVKCGQAILMQAAGQWGEPGTVVHWPSSDSPYLGLACGQGVLGLGWLHRPGGKRLSATEFAKACGQRAGGTPMPSPRS